VFWRIWSGLGWCCRIAFTPFFFSSSSIYVCLRACVRDTRFALLNAFWMAWAFVLVGWRWMARGEK
jgi:hypothetical protein